MKNNLKPIPLFTFMIFTGCTSMKHLYLSEIREEITKYPSHKNELIMEKDIADLPEPVQKYFQYCGYLGKEKMTNAKIEWKEACIKMGPDKKWMKLDCFQFNSVPEPVRIVYMKSNLLGLFPFEGRDKYQNGHGNMLIKFLKMIKIADAKGKEMDASALVTILSEALLIPTYALQDYIEWTEMDSNTAKAILRDNGTEVSGLFFFNDLGQLLRFETEDRYYSEKGKEYKKVKWSAVLSDYVEKNGIRFPTHAKAIWHFENGDFEYFKGTITNIKYNIFCRGK